MARAPATTVRALRSSKEKAAVSEVAPKVKAKTKPKTKADTKSKSVGSGKGRPKGRKANQQLSSITAQDTSTSTLAQSPHISVATPPPFSAPPADVLDTPVALGDPVTILPSPGPPANAPAVTAGPVAPIVAPIAASAPAVTAGPVAPIVAPIAASVPAVTAGPVAPIVTPIASPVVSTTIPPPATFMNTGSSSDECIVPVTSGIISGTSTNTSGASATGSQEKQKRSSNNKEGKKNKDKNKNRASSTNEDELSVLREQVRQLIAERDKQKADAAHQSGPASDAQFDKPDTEAGLLAKMKLTDNKYLYNQIRSIATSLCEQGSIDCMIDWRRQPHDRLSKVASQLAKRVPYLQKFTHNWAAYDILKTVLRNKRGYKRKMEKKHGIVDSCPAVGAACTPEAESQGSGMRGLDEDDVNDMDIGDRTARDESERNDGSSDDDLDSDLISDLDEGSDSASEGEDSSDGDSCDDDSDSGIDEVDARRQRHVQEKRTKHARKTERYKAHVSKKSKSKSQSKPKSRSKKRKRLILTSDDERVIEVRRLKKKSRQS